MLFRFSFYGFLKNLRFFEPFIILYFRQMGLSFTSIGWLIGYREICINILEIPSGAVADIFGRRRCMIISFLAYIGSFACFALSESFALLVAAMTLFAAGEAFRTGTHKAMIFDFLSREGRIGEKTQFYGTTRSWSKVGTAVSVLLSSTLVYLSARGTRADYSVVFWASIVPYCIGLLNFVAYPKYLDGEHGATLGIRSVVRHVVESFEDCFTVRRLRLLLVETMTYEGLFNTVKDYVQPLVRQWVLVLPLVVFAKNDDQRTAVLMGVVWFVLAVVSGIGSKQSDRFARAHGGEERAAWLLWVWTCLLYAALAPCLHWPALYPVGVVLFIGIHLVQNLFRPIQLSRYDAHAGNRKGATILSVEAQGKSAATFLLAPLVGYLVDQHRLGVVGLVAAAVTLLRLMLRLVRRG